MSLFSSSSPIMLLTLFFFCVALLPNPSTSSPRSDACDKTANPEFCVTMLGYPRAENMSLVNLEELAIGVTALQTYAFRGEVRILLGGKDPAAEKAFLFCEDKYNVALEDLREAGESFWGRRYLDVIKRSNSVANNIKACQNAFNPPSLGAAIKSNNEYVINCTNVVSVFANMLMKINH